MFLRAGALSLALLLASRLLGVLRESAQAAAFGRSAMADIAVLLLTLPDLLVSIAASGALAYVLLPAWAGQPPLAVASLQRRVARRAVAAAVAAAVLLVVAGGPLLDLLAGGLPPSWRVLGLRALLWVAVALPLSALAALWATRLQHERDFLGMYGANLVVNAVLVAGLLAAARFDAEPAVLVLGITMVVAMLARLAWLAVRLPLVPEIDAPGVDALPRAPVWAWAIVAAGLPLALPFAARSAASQAGEGALAVFNYAWKLVELPLVLAIQLVASLAFPAVARALAPSAPPDGAAGPVRVAFALAWAMACAAVAGLAWGAPAVAQLLFGWGRMPADGLRVVADWGLAGSWGLLPQAVAAVALTVLATQGRMQAAAWAYAAGLLVLVAAGAAGIRDGALLMLLLNATFLLVAVVCVAALGREARLWVPWRSLAWSTLGLIVAAGAARLSSAGSLSTTAGLAAAAAAASCTLAFALWRSPELRQALRR